MESRQGGGDACASRLFVSQTEGTRAVHRGKKAERVKPEETSCDGVLAAPESHLIKSVVIDVEKRSQ
jgi:hypothetical protein